MSINSRTKGKVGEQEIVKLLKDAGFDVARNLDQTRDGGYDITGIDEIALEVKRAKKPLINKWWEQTARQAKADQYPILAYRLDNQKWKVMTTVDFLHDELIEGRTVTLEWDDFIYYLRERI